MFSLSLSVSLLYQKTGRKCQIAVKFAGDTEIGLVNRD